MSFGFSVGDFISVIQLICDITATLRDAGGARSEYQELIRELETLKTALEHVDALRPGRERPETLTSVKCAALSCRQPLDDFLKRTRKYARSLDVWAKGGVVQGAADKLRWAFGHKEAVRKLQSYLNVHVGVINMLLAEHGLAKMVVAEEEASAENVRVRESLRIMCSLIDGVGEKVSSQALAVQRVHSMMATLVRMVNGELRSSWRTLAEMVANVW
jgi:hypothetical protein